MISWFLKVMLFPTLVVKDRRDPVVVTSSLTPLPSYQPKSFYQYVPTLRFPWADTTFECVSFSLTPFPHMSDYLTHTRFINLSILIFLRSDSYLYPRFVSETDFFLPFSLYPPSVRSADRGYCGYVLTIGDIILLYTNYWSLLLSYE